MWPTTYIIVVVAVVAVSAVVVVVSDCAVVVVVVVVASVLVCSRGAIVQTLPKSVIGCASPLQILKYLNGFCSVTDAWKRPSVHISQLFFVYFPHGLTTYINKYYISCLRRLLLFLR